VRCWTSSMVSPAFSRAWRRSWPISCVCSSTGAENSGNFRRFKVGVENGEGVGDCGLTVGVGVGMLRGDVCSETRAFCLHWQYVPQPDG
jgi:hypothetical protein